MNVRNKEVQAEAIARVLDNAMALPGLRPKFGLDPVVGLFPIVGDTMATIGGAAILVMHLQLLPNVTTAVVPAHTPIFSLYPVTARAQFQLTDARAIAS